MLALSVVKGPVHFLRSARYGGIIKRTVFPVRSSLEIRYERNESRSPTSKNFNATSSKDTEQCAYACAA